MQPVGTGSGRTSHIGRRTGLRKLKMKALGAYAEHNSFNAKTAQAESDEDSAAAKRYSLLKDKWLAKSGDLSSVYAAFCN